MKRLFQIEKTRIPFKAGLCAKIFCLFALTAPVLAKTPPPHLSTSGATKTARTSSAGSTMSEGTQVKTVPPFVGTNSETWERFGVNFVPDGTSILGGIATISGCCMVAEHNFVMCSVIGVPSDGTILMEQDRPEELVIISFSQPVSAFGAYWGSGLHCGFGDAATVLTFQDVNGNVIGSDMFLYQGNGTLQWHGYAFATPIKTITRTASDGQEGLAMDGLQATVAPSGGNSALLSNISTRMIVEPGDNVIIGGLIITGSGQKTVAVRAIGPSLPLQGALNDPVLELQDAGGALIASNDNWRTSQQAAIVAAGLAPGDDRDSALITTLSPGNYTATVRGANNATGIAIAEVYDLDAGTPTARLGNISTRGHVLTVDNVMIGGFIITGTGQKNVIVRALGPSLAQHGVTNPLLDPTLELHDGSGAVIASDDNWKDSQQTQIQATGLAPTDDRESAILRTLSPGNYTAIVRGVNSSTGIALVEVYGLD